MRQLPVNTITPQFEPSTAEEFEQKYVGRVISPALLASVRADLSVLSKLDTEEREDAKHVLRQLEQQINDEMNRARERQRFCRR